MVRSRWILSAVFGLAWAGLGRGQAPTPAPAPAASGERLITVQEMDRPAQKCRLLKTWREPDGSTAYQVQAVGNGEILTIVETGQAAPPAPAGAPGPRVRAVATRIFHWGQNPTPPLGTPVPPANATVVSNPVKPAPATQAPAASAPAKPAPTPATPVVTAPAAPAPTPAAPAVRAPALPSPMPIGSVQPAPGAGAVSAAVASPAPTSPYSPQVQRTTQLTPTTPRLQPEPQSPTGQLPAGTPPAPLVPGTKSSTGDCQCQCNPCGTTSGACTICQTAPGAPLSSAVGGAPPKPTLLRRLFHKDDEVVVVGPVTPTNTVVTTPGAPAVAKAPGAAPVPTAAPEASDFRQSWGRVEPWKLSQSVQTSQAVPCGDPSCVPEGTESKRSLFGRKLDPSKPPVTVWRKGEKATDPINDPEWYHHKAVSDLETKKDSKKDDKPGVARASDRPGMGSVLGAPGASTDAGANAFGPGLPTPGPLGPPPSPPNPYRSGMIAQTPAMPPMPMDRGIPQGMANAFTPGGTARPIPADFGSTEYPANAFVQPFPHPTAMVTSGEPPMPMGMPMPGYRAPTGYGPMPQAPMGGPAYRPVGYQQMPAVLPPGPQAGGLPEGAGTPQLLGMLKDSLYPSQREWAADCLARQNWRSQPQVVDALVVAARQDPAALVRAGCVRALGKMKANTLPVLQAVQSLKSDGDPRVRHEVDETLAALGVSGESHDSGVRPVSATLPEGRLP
jgi:hypothetical protein